MHLPSAALSRHQLGLASLQNVASGSDPESQPPMSHIRRRITNHSLTSAGSAQRRSLSVMPLIPRYNSWNPHAQHDQDQQHQDEDHQYALDAHASSFGFGKKRIK